MSSPVAQVRISDGAAADATAIADVLAAACVHSEIGGVLEPDPQARKAAADAYLTWLVTDTLTGGTAQIAIIGGGLAGAALWTLHDPEHATRSGTGRGVAFSAEGPERAALAAFFSAHRQIEWLADRRSPAAVHHRLRYLGVHPRYQRAGVANALLSAHHTRLRQTGMPTLVVADHVSRLLFERHRYSPTGPPALLPSALPLTAMWRAPDPPGPAPPGPRQHQRS